MKQYTKQQAFDAVVERALQYPIRTGEKTEHGFICKFRANSSDDPGCFVGCLLDPAIAFEADQDQWDLGDLIDVGAIEISDASAEEELLPEHPAGRKFLDDLRVIHDSCEPVEWERELKRFAVQNDLNLKYSPDGEL